MDKNGLKNLKVSEGEVEFSLEGFFFSFVETSKGVYPAMVMNLNGGSYRAPKETFGRAIKRAAGIMATQKKEK